MLHVNLDIAKLWIAKNDSESENQNWILSYTKPCPKCQTKLKIKVHAHDIVRNADTIFAGRA